LRIKVSRPVVNYDFQTIVMSFNTFFRRQAAQALQRAGFDFDFVEPEFQGKYAAEADMVQLVVPIVARIRLKTGYVYCERCKVVDGIPEAGATWGLYDGHQIRALPFFLPVESGPLIVSSDFVEAARRVGVRGLIEGDRLKGATLEPVQVISDPVPDHPAIPWPRLRDVAPLPEPSRARGRTKKARIPDVAPSWNTEGHALFKTWSL